MQQKQKQTKKHLNNYISSLLETGVTRWNSNHPGEQGDECMLTDEFFTPLLSLPH